MKTLLILPAILAITFTWGCSGDDASSGEEMESVTETVVKPAEDEEEVVEMDRTAEELDAASEELEQKTTEVEKAVDELVEEL